MACVLDGGAIEQEGERDEDGHRTYRVTWQVYSTTGLDGPANVMQTPGLPVPGTVWNYRADVDIWAWCRPQMTVTKHPNDNRPEDPRQWWSVQQTFSTRPPSREQAQRQRPPDSRLEDPLFFPPRVSGQTVAYTEEISYDRNGKLISTSCGEPIRGPQVEFDFHRSQVVIEQNVLSLQLGLCESMVDTVNDATLWDEPARFVKLSGFSWSWQYYGNAFRYYTRTFTFDIFGRYVPDTPGSNSTTFTLRSGHDRIIPDEGTLVLRGKWDRDPNHTTFKQYIVDSGLTINNAKPGDIVAYMDYNSNPTTVLLDGSGRPWDRNSATTGTDDDTQGWIDLQYYRESNFLLLGIPTDLE